MLLGTLGASLLTGRGMYRAGNQGQGLFRAGQGIKKELKKNHLPKLKKGAYIINLDHSKNTGTHWVVIFVKKDEVIYFDSFGVEYIPKEIMEKIEQFPRK